MLHELVHELIREVPWFPRYINFFANSGPHAQIVWGLENHEKIMKKHGHKSCFIVV